MHIYIRIIMAILVALWIIISLLGYAAAEEGAINLQTQMLGLSGVSNARQLGGYPAADGRHVKGGVLLRSGTLSDASPDDLKILKKEYKLHTVIDLRTTEEAAQKPDPEMEGIRYFSLPVLDEEQDTTSQAAIVDIYRLYGNDPGRAYVEMVRAGALSEEMYSSFFDSKAAMVSFRQMFDVLLTHEKGAILLHCTGGKDRAGLASALILSVLDVDEETILADFTLTNEVLREKIAYITALAGAHTDDPDELEQVAELAGVSEKHMRLIFDRANQECGSMLAFVQQKIGLTDAEVATLRDLYLE